MTNAWRTATLALTLALVVRAVPAAAETCTYSVDPNGISVVWTAFKFTEKTAVNGKFNTRTVSGPTAASSPMALAGGLSMEIDGGSAETDNPARNATIREFFFGKLAPSAKIEASVVDVKGDEQAGTIDMKITMNGVSRVVPFAYSATPEGEVTAKGSIDMLDFAMKAAHDSIHRTCEDLHTGADGVSKTWTEVDLTVTGRFERACS